MQNDLKRLSKKTIQQSKPISAHKKVLTSGWDLVFASCACMIQTVRAFRKVGPVHVPWLRLWRPLRFSGSKIVYGTPFGHYVHQSAIRLQNHHLGPLQLLLFINFAYALAVCATVKCPSKRSPAAKNSVKTYLIAT